MLVFRYITFILFVLCLVLVIPSAKPIITHKPIHVVYHLIIDPDFSDYEKDIITNATNDWSYASNGLLRFDIAYSYDPMPITNAVERHTKHIYGLIRPIEYDNWFVQWIDMILASDMLGYYEVNAAIPNVLIVGSRIANERDYSVVVQHELSHAIGMFHSSKPNTLMYRSIASASNCLTRTDMEQFCHIYDCDVDDMNYCVKGEEAVCQF